jgi:guanylate cyclase
MFLASFLGLLVFSTWIYFITPDVSLFPEEIIHVMTIINIAGPIIIYVLAIAYFGREKNKFQAQADNLLLNILPVDIANTLKKSSRFIAQHHPNASILFADIVGFTPMSSNLTPTELVELLNNVFSYFDSLTEKYQMEKIKTIGDCYMVAAGVPLSREDHALAITQMAVEMQDYVNTHTFLERKLSFRIGINSGEMISGVIGKKKFAYDLWGDTVNTASRMESHGEEGCIQITRATYELIKDDFICEPKGFINIKGKGEMEIWHVLGSKPSKREIP